MAYPLILRVPACQHRIGPAVPSLDCARPPPAISARVTSGVTTWRLPQLWNRFGGVPRRQQHDSPRLVVECADLLVEGIDVRPKAGDLRSIFCDGGRPGLDLFRTQGQDALPAGGRGKLRGRDWGAGRVGEIAVIPHRAG